MAGGRLCGRDLVSDIIRLYLTLGPPSGRKEEGGEARTRLARARAERRGAQQGGSWPALALAMLISI